MRFSAHSLHLLSSPRQNFDPAGLPNPVQGDAENFDVGHNNKTNKVRKMKKIKGMLVQMVQVIICAGSIAAAAAAAPAITVAIEVDSNWTWTDILYLDHDGGYIADVQDFSNNNKRVARGGFTKVFAAHYNGAAVVPVYHQTNYTDAIWVLPVTGLSTNGTSAANIFILELGAGGTNMTFRSMSGGISGTVSQMLVDESSDKIFFAGDFGGSFTYYADFKVWDIGNISWDTYTSRLNGYDGYWPTDIEKVGSNTIRLTIPTAYGTVNDDIYGSQVIPWTTTKVDWNISGTYWTNWQ